MYTERTLASIYIHFLIDPAFSFNQHYVKCVCQKFTRMCIVYNANLLAGLAAGIKYTMKLCRVCAHTYGKYLQIKSSARITAKAKAKATKYRNVSSNFIWISLSLYPSLEMLLTGNRWNIDFSSFFSYFFFLRLKLISICEMYLYLMCALCDHT